ARPAAHAAASRPARALADSAGARAGTQPGTGAAAHLSKGKKRAVAQTGRRAGRPGAARSPTRRLRYAITP
ncbi:hypothetical protein, partial [Streptomyces olivaceus]|uniref:hypothetical protein n=1 Tax=Streptomyces olivaceus TaxID=47716 RepID=UPI004056489A